jgi:hypothetical protein
MATVERRGRPRSISWIGKLGSFVNEYTVERLAGELQIDLSEIYRWAHGDRRPPVQRAIVIVEVAKAAGTDLTLEDIYESDIARIRYRIRNSLSPL